MVNIPILYIMAKWLQNLFINKIGNINFFSWHVSLSQHAMIKIKSVTLSFEKKTHTHMKKKNHTSCILVNFVQFH
jgi:hypothetical protein